MRLFLGNLPFGATEDDIQALFAQAGATADSVQVMRDKFSGKSRGFGFAEITDDSAATQVINACNGRQLMGRALVVNEARPTTPGGGGFRDRGPRGGGAGYGGGGGYEGGGRDRY
ncbi:MAG: RNA-binding protein [Acidobacteria bacterium]|nr:RNA-binding protein [Acidobacteriota bacterium]